MENISGSAKELSAMELNNIKLDAKHTVLTPQYLEKLIAEKDNPNPSEDPTEKTPPSIE